MSALNAGELNAEENRLLELWRMAKAGHRATIMQLLRTMARPVKFNQHLGFVECWFCKAENNCYLFHNRPRCRACKRRHERTGDATVLVPGGP